MGRRRSLYSNQGNYSWMERSDLDFELRLNSSIPQKQIDPTFIASVFTTTLATFGVQTGKKKEEPDSNNTNKDDANAKSN